MRSDLSKDECFKILEDDGWIEYGKTIPREVIFEAFGVEEIEYPAMRYEIKQQELEELAVTSFMRDKLLNRGMYLKGGINSYRILLPSENAGQVLSYMHSADRKLKRALKLNKNTPAGHKIHSQDEVRIFMKQESIKHQKEN